MARLDFQLQPEDSASLIVSRTSASRLSSRKSHRSSHSGSHGSSVSSLSVARAKEAAHVAELRAEAAVLLKRQQLEKQKFHLQLEEERLTLETKLAKSQAREQALTSIVEAVDHPCPLERKKTAPKPPLVVPDPINLESKPRKENPHYPEEEHRSNLNLEAAEWHHPPLPSNSERAVSESSEVPSSPSERAFHEILGLHQQQNALQQQQNKIVEMLAIQQQKSSLPQPRVPIFDGDPMEYGPFVRAFESIIESKTSSNSERLHYLEQFTSGDVRELVRSCHYLPAEKGYQEAQRLIRKKFGDNYHVVAAYETKALNWPDVKAEDGQALNRFAIFLLRCRNAMESSKNLTKLEQPETIKKLALKSPFSLRVRWRRLVDEIMEDQGRAIRFNDLAEFVDHEARVATNPLFGKIVEDSRPRTDTRRGLLNKGSHEKTKERRSFASHINDCLTSPPTSESPSQGSPPVEEVSCLYCNDHHALESWKSLRSRPYEERIEFMKSKRLCFGCLSTEHTARNCPKRKTCAIVNCTRKHPTVLHTNSVARRPEANNATTSTSSREEVLHVQSAMVNADGKISALVGTDASKTAMAVVPVKVWPKGNGTPVITYAFLDNGSSSSFCTEALMRQLGVNGPRTLISLTTLDRKNSLTDSFVVQDLAISDLDENVFVKLPTLYTRPEIPVSKEDIPNQVDIDKWPHLSGVYLPDVEVEIGLLIASDVPQILDPLEVKHCQDGGPYASRTIVGWVVNGPLGCRNHRSRIPSFFFKADHDLNQMVKDYYNGNFPESSADDKPEMSQEELRFLKVLNSTAVLKEGHYEMALPFRDREVAVPNNRVQAEQRALWLKRKLHSKKDLYADYKAFMAEILEKGYARKVPAHMQGINCVKRYIPHHGIYHPRKPGKIRVVCDCSAKFQGKSVNDLLLKGPDLTNTLFGVLMRFCQERIAIMADIEAMFYQVRVAEEDRTFLRFLWWPEGNLDENLEEYQMVVHLFGAASSPACSNFELRKTAEDNSDPFPREVVNSVNKNFYVDDCLKSLPSTEEALPHASDLRCLLARGGFRLTKWISNSRRVLDAIPEAEGAKEVKNLDLTKEDLPVERALGVRWCIETDTFGFKIDLKHSPPTRRGILSVVSSVYDPLGLAAPFVLPAKRLLQDLCREKLGWDDAIPSNYEVSWERWLADLPKLSKFSVERCLKPDGFGVITSSQLYHFADASEIGYGSVSYLRLVNGRNEAHCSFLCAKSRVAPLKMITIPCLELSAAVTAVKQDRLLKRELEISVNARSVFWTDSTAVLRYVKNETNRYHTFVANRVAIIRDGSQPNQWFHVNGDNNPADDASCGLTADIFLRQSRWLTGPAFLWKHDSMWPTQDELFGEIANDDPEVKREVRAAMSSLGTPGSPLLYYASRCSSWSLLVKVVAWLFRYKNDLLKASKGDKPRNDSLVLITLEEIQRAEGEILKHVQQQSFPEETANPKKQVKKSSRLYKLDPIFVDGLLRVGGRLRNSTLSPESKNQIILPRDDHVSRLIIYHHHKTCGHSGKEHVLSRIRERFWITQGSSAVKSVLAKCVICRRSQASLCQQKMADLPEDRVQPDRPPFTSVGLDFFGPFQVRRGRILVKRYGVIFTCLAIRAVHIEVAFSLDKDSFLLALRRFIARRGQVKEIYSDNGTNFTSGERELRDAISEWNQERIHNSLLQKDIKWTFSPPYGSHFGGIWERCIRTIRKILRSLLREQITDDESLLTLMCEVESILNSRPISTVSSDPYDLEPLTPNHLLLLKSEVPLPPGLFQHKDLLSRRRWRQVQYLADVFWRIWCKEFLPLLQIRQKWVRPKRNLAVGDIVLVATESSRRNSWPLGRIVEVFPDKRGLVRRAKVSMKSGVFERPIDKLCLLVEGEK